MKSLTLLKSVSILILSLAAIGPAKAEKTHKGIYNFNSIGASWNPLGIQVDNRLCLRFPLSARTGILWESTKLDIGIQSSWTPADEVAGVFFTVEPVAFFAL